jgi:hypothetical protein
MKTAKQLITDLATFLNQQGRPSEKITVRGSRNYIRRQFPKKARGGPAFVGEHEIIIVPATKAQPLDQVELL